MIFYISVLFLFCEAICGPIILTVTNQTQNLTSPNYPLSYSNNLKCVWKFQFNRYSNVRLRFTDLDLSDTKDCLSNYFELHYVQASTRTEMYEVYLLKYNIKLVVLNPNKKKNISFNLFSSL